MTEHRLEAMIEQAARVICDPSRDLRLLPQHLAQDWPEAPALELALALASSADAAQSFFAADSQSYHRAAHVWRHAAMIGVELHHLTLQGLPAQTAGDLLAHWRHE